MSFTCLKAFAFDDRGERKDAHDLIYCVEYAPDGPDQVAEMFREALAGKHGAVIRDALAILRKRFAQDDRIEGYRKDGPVAVARFELDKDTDPDHRLLRQRQASDVIEQLLSRIGN